MAEDADKVRKWLDIVGKTEDAERFSAVLLKNKAFQDWAEASAYNVETEEWFEQIILGESESEFGDLCQRINEKLLVCMLVTYGKKCKLGMTEHHCIQK